MGEHKLCGAYDGHDEPCVKERDHAGIDEPLSWQHADRHGFKWGGRRRPLLMVDSAPPENILQEADRLTSTSGTRPDDYGHPRDNLQQTAKLWEPILGVPVSAEQVALCMIQLKISRECHKQGRDNLVDIAGWARTIERLEE